MKLVSDDLRAGAPMPEAFAFCRIGDEADACVQSTNINPHLAWVDVPDRVRSFALSLIDADAPSSADDVNKPGRRVAKELPRADFVHWLVADIPRECREIARGACSDGATAHGKRAPLGPGGSKQGVNDYTGWFASDPAMAGTYLGYDGPCPPWNDERVHEYRFRLHALDIDSLGLAEGFTHSELADAMQGHVLAGADLVVSYTLNRRLR